MNIYTRNNNLYTGKKCLLLLTFIMLSFTLLLANNPKTVVYLIPGQGSDYRLFNNLKIDTSFEVRNIYYSTPEKDMSMREFAKKLSSQIDTNRPYINIGVSLGGMLATEMTDFMNPEKTIIISSAKCRTELPKRYKFQRKFPVYKAVSGNVAKCGAKIMQPIVEPDRNKEKETFKNMLDDKDPIFLKRTIAMIMEWDRIDYPQNIIHIHGDNDSTIPIRNVKYN